MVFTDSMPPAPTTQYPGLYDGTVRNVEKDSQQQPLKRGEIMVSIPSIYDQERPEDWILARPCFPYGHFFVPNPGDKVWLAFQNGDPCKPVWLGIWYPKDSLPTEVDVSPPLKRLIRSSPNHQILINDMGDEESLLISDHVGNTVELISKADNEALILRDKAGSSIELKGDGVFIKAAQNLTIDASGKEVVIKASSVDVQQG